MAAQAQLEALDEKTARGKIESRSERNMFKMTGQIPPTPTTGPVDEDKVYIRTEDLRSHCRAANSETQPEQDELAKSPKRKLFHNIRNPFSKSSGSAAPPSIPSKAAQVLGTATRQPRTIQARPIKPALSVQQIPAKSSRPETAKSLPAKIADPDRHAHRHHSGTSRRSRQSGRVSPGRDGLRKQASDAENNPPMPASSTSSDSIVPPTPPAKDTPPGQRPASPLRRVAPAQDLRQRYDIPGGEGMQLHIPALKPTPSPLMDVLPRQGGASPTKSHPYSAQDYTKPTVGDVLQWPFPERTDSPGKTEGRRSEPLEGATLEALHLPRPDSKSQDHPSSVLEHNNYCPLQPRFYSPKHLAAYGFREGETPSKNTDQSRLLYSVPSKSTSNQHQREDSTEGSIKMIFQGDPGDIDPNSPTARELELSKQRGIDTQLTTRVMQELRINDQCESSAQNNGHSNHPHADQSSSRLTDMLNTASPGRSESHGDFRPHCPSAVPSPLHRAPVLVPAARAIAPPSSSFGPFPPPLAPKSIDDHFFMTNEHLDVVGKTTWDLLEMFNKQQKSVSKARHDQLAALISKHSDEMRSWFDAVKENTSQIAECMDRVDGMVSSQGNVYATLETLKDSVEEGIPKMLTEQEKKMASMEAEVKELKQMVQALHKSSEQKASEAKTGGYGAGAGQGNSPNKGYGQGFGGYLGAGPEAINLHDNRGPASPPESQNDSHVGYQNGSQWGGRSGYLGRNNKEERPLYPTNPYHFANGGGHFTTGYSGSYSPFNYSPNAPDQQYPFNNHGQAK
ncbi:uncharacterized protein SETTUDRAFT_119828 [Exserohilum turcica Et28A]